MAHLKIECVTGRLRMNNECIPKIRRNYDTGILFTYPHKEIFIHRSFTFYTEGQRFFVSDLFGNSINFLPSTTEYSYEEVLKILLKCQTPQVNIYTDNTLEGLGNEDFPLGVNKDLFIEPGDDVSELVNDAGYLTIDTTPDVNDGALSINPGNGLSGGGVFTANQEDDEVISLSIDDTTLSKIDDGSTAYSWGNHATEGYLKPVDISGKEDKSNKKISLNNPDNTGYPTTKAVSDAIQSVEVGIVQSDWNEVDNGEKSYIKNKPTKVSDFQVDIDTDDISEGSTNRYYTDNRVNNNPNVSANTSARHTHTNKSALDNVSNAGSGNLFLSDDGSYKLVKNNVQSDWDQTNSNQDDYIKNKPTKVSDFQIDIDTDDISEGSTNKYYTDARVQSQVTSQVTKQFVDNLGVDAATLNGKSNFVETSEKGSPNGVATLNSQGKLSNSQVPAIAITETFEAADIAARDQLPTGDGEGVVGEGDVVIVTDATDDPDVDEGGATYIYNGSEYKRLVTPTEAVSSVNGQKGVVVLSSDDLSEGSINLYYTENRVNTNTNVSANTAARHTHPNKSALDNVTNSGGGDKYLSDDGTYKTVKNNVQSDWNQTNTSQDDYIKNKPTKVSDFQVDIDTDNISEGSTNKYYTDTRVNNNPNVSANTNARHTHSNKGVLDGLIDTGSGDQFLGDDGSYKYVSWGVIKGDISNQTDLTSRFNSKSDVNHTHTSAAITDFNTAVSNNQDVIDAVEHTTNTNNPHNVTAAQVGVNKTFIDGLGVNAATVNGKSDTDFATSAQGSLADTALQPGDDVSELVNDANYANESFVNTGLAGIVGSSVGLAIHGSNSNEPRPQNYLTVIWIGDVEPDNADENDIWVNDV